MNLKQYLLVGALVMSAPTLHSEAVVSVMEGSPVHEAAQRGDAAEVQRLLTERPLALNHPDLDFKTPLHYAAKLGHIAVMKVLLSRPGIELELGDFAEDTPLHLAIKNNHLKAAEMLLKKKADPEPRNADKQQPLHYAAERGSREGIELLKRYGIQVKDLGKHGGTALHWAAINGQSKVVIWLIDKQKLDIEWHDHEGLTALHWAAGEAHAETVRILLSRGANAHAVGGLFSTNPLQYAKYMADKRKRAGKPQRAGYEATMRLLREATKNRR